jgi:N-acetyl-gamma-glutamyl-phosphate reductase
MTKCAVIGATGYAGAELSRLLLGHPEVAELVLSSASAGGESISSIYPNLAGAFGSSGRSGILADKSEAIERADVVFAGLPAGHAEEIAAACAAKGSLFIDLSGDFRFGTDEATYTEWYGKPYARPELHTTSVYGLPELNRAKIRALGEAKSGALLGPRIIANPGCYPTASTLGLYPALKGKLAETEGIIIDAKSGVTGSGKEPTKSTHYPECADTIAPYKIEGHRHLPEIDAVLSLMAGTKVASVFTPHLAPMCRGIVATAYFRLAKKGMKAEELREAYAAFYKEEPFVRVLAAGAVATNRNVRFSNYCDISAHIAHDGKTAVIVSAIDNMVKGSAGEAIQNMNIALGLDEKAGLSMLPPAF